MKITLVKNVRVFKRSFPAPSLSLSQTGKILNQGNNIEIGEPCTMIYDHSDKLAVPVVLDELDFFILVEEIGKLNTVQS